MKYTLLLLACLAAPVCAQPQSREDNDHEQRSVYRDNYRETEMARQRYCRHWRHLVQRNPQLRLPRVCWRDYRPYYPPYQPPRPRPHYPNP
jgi:hypothetical protein